MKHANFPESNKILTRPEGTTEEQCKSLHVWSDNKYCISLWKPSWRDMFRLLLKGEVWLWVHGGSTQPPVYVGTEYPFNED